ncbi:MAG: hypothetical protein ACJAQ6_002481 [Arenicella sp.]|jgi:hypothetical protein
MQIIKQLVQISLRKREPQDLDFSLQAAILLAMGIVFLRYISFLSMSSLSNPFGYSLVSIIGESLAIFALLRSQNKTGRFVQTITALFGITVLATMVSVIMSVTVILQLALPFLLLWSIYLMVLILRAALDCSLVASLMFTIGYNAIGYLLVMLLFPKFQTEMLVEWETIKAAIEAAQLAAQSK